MSNNIYYNSVKSQQPQSNAYNYVRHRRHHRHSSYHSSPTRPIHHVSSHSTHPLTRNNDNHNIQHPPALISNSFLSSNQSTAYFLDRIDLENYTTTILKQTVESILSNTKPRGLKVKISLPDDGLIIHNITDPNQSWIYKKSELLYFWRDPTYLNIIVVVTFNRSRQHANRPYAASIFRLRNNDSTQAFLQQAQLFFSSLPISLSSLNTSKSSRNKSIDRGSRKENRIITDQQSLPHSKIKALSTINEQHFSKKKTLTNRNQSPRPASIRRVTRAEFDPGKAAINSRARTYNRRSYSETTSSTDSQIANSSPEVLLFTEKMDDDDDDKMTSLSNNLSLEEITELMRELKDLRNEITLLKLEKRIQPVTCSMSTSPLTIDIERCKQTTDSSTATSPTFPDIASLSEVDAETQTDFSLIHHRRRQTSKKNKKTMIGSSGISTTKNKKTEDSHKTNSRTYSNSSTNTVSDQEGTTSESSSQVNNLSNGTNKTLVQEQYQPMTISTPPRPILVRSQNSFMPLNNSQSYKIQNGNPKVSNFNSIEEGSLPLDISTTIEKEMPKFLSTNISSSNPEIIRPSVPIIAAGTTSFQPSLENSNVPTEHIYENIPILIQQNSNRESYYNIPIVNVDNQQQKQQQQQEQQQQQQQQQNQSNGYAYYPVTNNRETETQQQYVIPGQTFSNSHPTTNNNNSETLSSTMNIQPQKPQIISAGRHRNQPIFFANHLTNPIFNVDKQLLINTVANQFGVDLNSPQLQQLVTNQHLFAARRRTFANMVWQLTPDEETALCSPNTTSHTDIIDTDAIDINYSTNRSILKAANRFQSISKRRSISWDTTLG
ncbi:unnamed protein product [Rotaria sp. Silwood2]|nr:unnamed protein product [Rotaria sp. Silwood2]CAF2742200.1 unnamed protein product [Rotaria sp. Silwood2]CAF3192924.1 unnamed protein product [Rotaria sp. Silwood2]CAF3924502.1 unnamed protein product [Rotaria sp. Silwood2]CAF3980366.1 unnamed protein product [Rotaria sp. Silwood2]